MEKQKGFFIMLSALVHKTSNYIVYSKKDSDSLNYIAKLNIIWCSLGWCSSFLFAAFSQRYLQFSYPLLLVLLHSLYPVDVRFQSRNRAKA